MIGVYGGTFDPVHYGHLRTALEVKEALTLDQVRFIPCRLPPHRQRPSVPSEARRHMLEVALTDAPPEFVLDPRELERTGPSYMVDTLASLRAEVEDRPLCLILGLDAFRDLPAWHRWETIFDLAHVVVMTRPGYSSRWPAPLKDQVTVRVSEEKPGLPATPAGKIYFQPVTQLDISATFIRQCLAAGRDPRYLLPPGVLALIRRKGYYRNPLS
ncbi:nicotinate-nucleotide adenylyltransferase [Methylohalobius crimeensis]|uniref:nicotinate-nucleotide adenylyltransferase n=1 Tax=Methylohalobius crimeensis TaxID=244365 RepID=UPI0003B75266|nr:nicotinate-nucleotide adenylyltransferase [Methylohalobius crimeensis]